MYKKIISVMSVALVVFLCTSPVFASGVQNNSVYWYHTPDSSGNTIIDTRVETMTVSPRIVTVDQSQTRFDFYNYDGSRVNTATLSETRVGHLTFSYTPSSTGYVNASGSIQLYPMSINLPSYAIASGSNYYIVQYSYLVSVTLFNKDNDHTVEFDSDSGFLGLPLYPASSLPGTDAGFVFENLNGSELFVRSANQYNQYFISPDTNHLKNGHIILAPGEVLTGTFELSYFVYYQGSYSNTPINLTLGTLAYANTGSISSAANPSLLQNIQSILKSLRDKDEAYNSNSANSQNNTATSGYIDQNITSQHTQEQQIYSNANSSLANTGLGNYQFDSAQTGGLNGVSNDFTSVWNAMGSYNSVYVFSLTLSLALFILRHRKAIHG